MEEILRTSWTDEMSGIRLGRRGDFLFLMVEVLQNSPLCVATWNRIVSRSLVSSSFILGSLFIGFLILVSRYLFFGCCYLMLVYRSFVSKSHVSKSLTYLSYFSALLFWCLCYNDNVIYSFILLFSLLILSFPGYDVSFSCLSLSSKQFYLLHFKVFGFLFL